MGQQLYAKILGIVLLLVGVLGLFVGNGTLIVFGLTWVHSIVHLLSGVLALWAGLASDAKYAKLYNQVFGIIYGLVAVLGLLNVGFVVDLLNLNVWDNILHVVIAVVTLIVGFGVRD